MGHLPTPAQFARLATLGATDAERGHLAQRGHDRIYIADVITEAARWPLGSGALRYYRLFHEYPRGARTVHQLEPDARAAIEAWRLVQRLAPQLEARFITCSWPSMDILDGYVDDLVRLARAGDVDAARNPGIEARITEASVLLAGKIADARTAGRIGPRDYVDHVAHVPERLRRAGREWRALADRQRAGAWRRRRSLWSLR